jgi:hypothetical protein
MELIGQTHTTRKAPPPLDAHYKSGGLGPRNRYARFEENIFFAPPGFRTLYRHVGKTMFYTDWAILASPSCADNWGSSVGFDSRPVRENWTIVRFAF